VTLPVWLGAADAGNGKDRRGTARRRSIVALALAAAIAAGACQAATASPYRIARYDLYPGSGFGFFDYRYPSFQRYPRLHHDKARRHRRRSLDDHEARRHSKDREPGKIPQGPLQIIVSINSQRVALYGNGVPVARSVVSTGVSGHPTPIGVFSVIQKDRWHRSNIYSNAPMPFMQRITWSGVALHAGIVTGRPASHGCIRLTHDFAKRLWSLTKIGVRVIIARDEVSPVEIAHPQLFVPKPKPADIVLAAGPPAPRADPGAAAEKPDRPADAFKTAAATATDANPSGESAHGKPGGSPAAKGEAPRKPLSVFISKKEGKLFVRQGFVPLFNTPVTIRDPEQPLGTHVFTALELKDNGPTMRWSVVSMPSESARRAQREWKHHHKKMSRAERREQAAQVAKATAAASSVPTAASALDRIEIPQEALDRISELLGPGTSLIISDRGMSGETGNGTDFIVLTR
jgi:L,D-transpeptidase catalytic domain